MKQALRVYAERDEARAVVRGFGMQTADEVEAYIDLLRWGASPGMLEALYLMNREIDIRDVLPTVRVPALVLHGSDDQVLLVDVGRYTAQRLPTARFVELPGVGHLALGGSAGDRIHLEIKRFTSEIWQTGGWEEAEPERMLATVLRSGYVAANRDAHCSSLREPIERSAPRVGRIHDGTNIIHPGLETRSAADRRLVRSSSAIGAGAKCSRATMRSSAAS
jgi:hypothetical protein